MRAGIRDADGGPSTIQCVIMVIVVESALYMSTVARPCHRCIFKMFPTFDVPPQHAETVGARKARRAKEEDITRRSSSTTSHSSGSTTGNGRRQTSANSSGQRTTERSGFGWFGKSSKKGVQEISALPPVKKSQPRMEPEPEPELESEPSVPVTSLHAHRTAQINASHRFPQPPPSRSLPLPPPSCALPSPPSLGLFSIPGTCIDSAVCKRWNSLICCYSPSDRRTEIIAIHA